MADIKDSPISQLSPTAELSSNDLFLVSKEREDESGSKAYTSNKVTVNDAVSSFIDYATGPISTYLSTRISAFTGTVTLKEWTYQP